LKLGAPSLDHNYFGIATDYIMIAVFFFKVFFGVKFVWRSTFPGRIDEEFLLMQYGI